MLFSHKSESRRRKSSPIVMLFRIGLSLGMFFVLALLTFQAFKYFISPSEGPDLFFSDPKAAITQILTSEDTIKTITGFLGFNFSKDNLPGVKDLPGIKPSSSIPSQPKKSPSGAVVLKFALIADSHNDNSNLAKALSMAKRQNAKFVIGLGDYTNTGTIEELENTKKTFEAGGLPYYLTPGDHDLWDSRDKGKTASSNFSQVFGTPYESFSDSDIRFVMVYNSDNYVGLDSVQTQWLKGILAESSDQKDIFVFAHEPLYTPNSDHFMGQDDKEVEAQAKELMAQFKVADVGGVFAGHVHGFTEYQSPDDISMMTVGAVTKDPNITGPRFAMVDVFEDGSYNILDIKID